LHGRRFFFILMYNTNTPLKEIGNQSIMARPLRYSIGKIEGLLLGTFIGDAIGSPFDGLPPNDIPPLDAGYIAANPPKNYTDDTQMSISVFEEMVENGGIDQRSLLERFVNRFTPWRGYSGGMLDVIEHWRDGRDIESAAQSLYGGAGSFGDGAAMRASPISAFFSLDEVNGLVEQVRRCSTLTHTHPYGIAGADLQAYIVLLALNDQPSDEWLERLFSFPTENAFKIKIEAIKNCLDRNVSPHDGAREIGNGADVLEAVPAALFSVLRNPLSFSDAVLYAVSMGGDTDTIGAMAGAIAGAMSGIGGIPPEWLVHLENGNEGRDFIRDLVRTAALK
jgi:poly(ADP-ribose) glycohydrolase ARH3